MALYAMNFVADRRYTEFVVTILIAAVIHKTVLLVIPAYIICRLKWRPWFYGVVAAGAGAMLLFPEVFRKLIFLMYPYYEDSAFDSGRISWVNILKAAAVLVLCIIFYRDAVQNSEKNGFYFRLSIVAFVIYACCSFMPEYTRIGYYFATFASCVLPSVPR